MEYADKRETANDPSLEEMTRVAIEVLRKNPKGYFLFVEGSILKYGNLYANVY